MDNNETDALTQTTDDLEKIHHERLLAYMPIIITLAMFATMGILGNCFTIRYYAAQRRKSSTATFIQFLGGIDLVVCVILFASIGNLATNVYFSNGLLCKALYFSTHLFIVSSVLVLWIISIDRYLKVCRPFGKQFSQSWAKWVVLAVMTLSFVLSLSNFIIYDAVRIELDVASLNPEDTSNENKAIYNISIDNNQTRESILANWRTNKSVPTLTGHYCTSIEDADKQLIVTISNTIDAVIVAVVIITFLITYGIMLRHISKSSNQRRTHLYKESGQTVRRRKSERQIYERQLYRQRKLSENSQSTPNIHQFTTSDDQDNYCLSLPRKHKTSDNIDPTPKRRYNVVLTSDQCQTEAIRFHGDSNQTLQRDESRSMFNINTHHEGNSTLNKRSKRMSTEANFTAMMAVVSVALIICFIPYLIMAGIRTLTKTSDREYGVLYQLALRALFLNSVINPIVFCAFNPRYRRFIRNGFTFNENTENLHSLTFVRRRTQNTVM